MEGLFLFRFAEGYLGRVIATRHQTFRVDAAVLRKHVFRR